MKKQNHAEKLFHAAYWELRCEISDWHPNPPVKLNRRDYPAKHFERYDKAAIYAAVNK